MADDDLEEMRALRGLSLVLIVISLQYFYETCKTLGYILRIRLVFSVAL